MSMLSLSGVRLKPWTSLPPPSHFVFLPGRRIFKFRRIIIIIIVVVIIIIIKPRERERERERAKAKEKSIVRGVALH
jgi:hypothetical protein